MLQHVAGGTAAPACGDPDPSGSNAHLPDPTVVGASRFIGTPTGAAVLLPYVALCSCCRQYGRPKARTMNLAIAPRVTASLGQKVVAVQPEVGAPPGHEG